MECYDVDFYHKENGDCPVDDFLESLDTKMRAKVLGAVALLEANGPQLREPYSKFIGDGIFEIRAKQSSNITRVLYFFYIGKRIVLTNGFIKKTQKTPPEEIALAKKYRADYLERKDLRNFLNKQLEDPEFKAEWEALQPELSLVQAMIDARKVSGLTQKELSERTGIAQADISKLENGNANPSLRTLQRLAAGMGMQVKIEFIPAPAK